ncbi:hypothetical protein Nepgr_025577 [Nepenthes gracilis]|uniref:Uncharacterized protein n=1 Tax=Nepenthes gracilis TaxID=150966 RepID=A0AAD3T746_NEPGR|nr:hypothetical protein Nepgr_025577 [Nepenthes gracilis]
MMTTTIITADAAEAEECHAAELPAAKTTKLLCLAIQIYSPMIMPPVASEEPLTEDGVGASLAAGMEDGAEIFVVQEAAATGPWEPEARGGESSSGSSFMTKDMASGLGAIISEAAQTYVELEASKFLGECIQSLELKLSETKSHIFTLES